MKKPGPPEFLWVALARMMCLLPIRGVFYPRFLVEMSEWKTFFNRIQKIDAPFRLGISLFGYGRIIFLIGYLETVRGLWHPVFKGAGLMRTGAIRSRGEPI